MRSSIKIIYQALLISVLLIGCKKTEDSVKFHEKPNVLIILADDLGYGDVSTYGQKKFKTPEIDGIAEQGVLSSNFYVPTPYCAPSRATLLTGRFPLRHGLIKNPTPDAHIQSDTIGLNPKEITLAEVFRESGYATKAIGKWHLGHKEKYFPVEQGFDEYYGILYSNDMRPVQIIENRDTIKKPVDQRLLTKDYTENAIEFLKRKRDNPFFLYLAHAMPHKPLAASDGFYTPETPNNLYEDVINELDWSVGEIMATLEELEILENTIVIFMSDNGPWYGGNTGGLKGMKATTWEGGIRVPFMIRYPKVLPQNTKIEIPLWSPDIFPTIFSLANIVSSKSNKLDGQDITAILQGKSKKHSPVFSMHNDEIMSIRKSDYKLFVQEPRYYKEKDLSNWSDPRGPDGTTIIAQLDGQATPADYPGVIPEKSENRIQLFNLKNDVSESHDLAKEKPEVVQELLDDYEKFKTSLTNNESF